MSLMQRRRTLKTAGNQTKRQVPDSDGFSSTYVYSLAMRCCYFPILGQNNHQTINNNNNNNQQQSQSSSTNEIQSFSRIVKNNNLVLANVAVASFYVNLEMRAGLMANIPKERDQVFSAAGLNFLKTVSANTQICTNFKDLVVLCGNSISNAINQFDRANNLQNNRTNEQYDLLVITVMELFITIARSAIVDSPKQGTPHTSDLLNKKESWASYLQFMLKSNSTASGSSTNNEQSQESSLTYWLRMIFDVPKDKHDSMLIEARKLGGEKFAFAELDEYMKEISTNSVKFSLPQDFDSPVAYENWKNSELATVKGLYQSMVMRFGTPQSQRHQIDVKSLMPSNRHRVYNFLVLTCLDHDLKHSKKERSLPGFLISKTSQQVLTECALRWRLGKVFRDFALLDILIQQYRKKIIILADVYPTFQAIMKMSENLEGMKKADLNYLLGTLKGFKTSLHSYLVGFTDDFKRYTTTDAHQVDKSMQISLQILHQITKSQIWRSMEPDLNLALYSLERQIESEILESINKRYVQERKAIGNKSKGVLVKCIDLAKAQNKGISLYGVFYPSPILKGELMIKLLAADLCLKNLILEYEMTDDDESIKDTLELYQVVRSLYDICEENKMPIIKDFDVEAWFHPFIIKYLDMTDLKCLEWVRPAVEAEQYIAILPPTYMYSSSVVDIFSSFHQALDFIEKFNWKELGKKDQLARKFIKTLSKSLKEYAALMFEEFKEIMETNSSDQIQFSQQSCMKVNNLLGANLKLAEVLEKLGVTNETQSTKHFDPTARRCEPDQNAATFNITIVRATDLLACDWTTSDPYTIMKHLGVELQRTRVIDKNLNPVWNETFMINLPHDLPDNMSFLDLEVFDKDYIGGDDLCGNASLFMRDRLYEDYLSHEVNIDLKPQGKLFLRVTKEGEIDDSGWWVKKAEEKIRETIEDMVRVYVEQLNRSFKFELEKSFPSSSSSYNFFSSVASSFKKQPADAITIDEVETDEKLELAILPLLLYLDEQFGVFNENLDQQKLKQMLLKIYPWLRGADIAKNRSNNSFENNTPITTTQENLITEKNSANLVIKLVWEEYLKTISVHLLSFASNDEKKKGGGVNSQQQQKDREKGLDQGGERFKLTKLDFQKVEILETTTEMLKSLFYCEDFGFSCAELEGTGYQQIRQTLNVYLRSR